MDEAKQRLVAAWLAKARDDLSVARLLIVEEKRLYAAGVYHCQQAAEKGLKAYLTHHDVPFPKTHDLETLLHLGRAVEPGWAVYVEHARELTPLATEYRYPGDAIAPTPELAAAAMSRAEELVAYASRQLEAG